MTFNRETRRAADDSLARWRALTPAQKREARRAVVVEDVVKSMAMENEPVSEAWIQRATTTRA